MRKRQLALFHHHIAGEDRPVGAVLRLGPVGGEVDRRLAVMAFQRRHAALRQRDAGTEQGGGKRGKGDHRLSGHPDHLTAP